MNKGWTRLAATQTMSAPLTSYGDLAVLGQFYSMFWRVSDPAGHKPHYFRSSSFWACFWSRFLRAKQKGWVTGNYNSRRWHSSKYDAGPTGQDGAFAKSSLLKLIKRQVESSANQGLNCYSKVLSMYNIPTMIWVQNKVMVPIQNPHLNEKMWFWDCTLERSCWHFRFDFIKQMKQKHSLVKIKH